MNVDIFMRVIDWFVSICETLHGKRPWLMEERRKKTPTIVVGNLPITVSGGVQQYWPWAPISTQDRKVLDTH